MTAPPDPPKSDDITDAFGSLKELILKVPDEWLIRLFESHTGRPFVADLEANNVERHLNSLKQMASMGSEEAIRNLAEIAMNISGFLEGLFDVPDAVKANVSKEKYTHRADGSHLGTKKFYRLMSKSVRIIAIAPLRDLKEVLRRIDGKWQIPMRLPDARGMFIRRILRHVSIPDTTAFQKSPKVARINAAGLIEADLILGRILEYRSQHLALAAAQRVIASFESWPVIVNVHAKIPKNDIVEPLRKLGLGANSKFRLSEPKKGGSDIATFVNEVFLTLSEERVSQLGMEPNDRRRYQEVEDRLRIGSSSVSPRSPGGARRRLAELEHWNSRTHWRRKAALLPDPSPVSLTQWVEAGMAYLTSISSRKSYSGIVESGKIQRDQERWNLRWKYSNFGESLEPGPRMRISKEDARNNRDLVVEELQLLDHWERGVEHAFEEFEWPESVNNRVKNSSPKVFYRSARNVMREKLVEGFKRIFAQ